MKQSWQRKIKDQPKRDRPSFRLMLATDEIVYVRADCEEQALSWAQDRLGANVMLCEPGNGIGRFDRSFDAD